MAGELQSLVSNFSRQRGLPLPPAEADGSVRFTLDLQLEVSLVQIGYQLLVEGRLCSLPESSDRAEELLARCLRQQLGRVRDYSEAVAMDPESSALVLYRRVDARSLDDGGFENLLSEFANSLEFWRLAVEVQHRSTAPQPMMPGMMTMVRP